MEALLFLPNEPVPADPAAIYEHDTFTFVEWSLSTDPGAGSAEEDPVLVLEPVEPTPEPQPSQTSTITSPL